MQVSRAPLRITLGGGGSDLHPHGYCLTATLDKYVTVAVADGFDGGYLLHYSEYEHARTVEEIKHPIIQLACRLYEIEPNIQVSSIADIPGGTGLGSSGAFAVALCSALSKYRNYAYTRGEIARHACLVDRTGWQDQMSAAYGGIKAYTDGTARNIPITVDTRRKLNENLVLFYTGYRRASADTLPYTATDPVAVKAIAERAFDALCRGDMTEFAQTLTDQWKLKRDAHPSPIHTECHMSIQQAMWRGLALGGKLIGAGDGGFLLFYSETPEELIASVKHLRHVPFRLVDHGVE